MPRLRDNQKLHYKMYKAGKRWLFAGVATFAVSTVLISGQVKADTTAVTNQSQNLTANSTVTSSANSKLSQSNQTANSIQSQASSQVGQANEKLQNRSTSQNASSVTSSATATKSSATSSANISRVNSSTSGISNASIVNQVASSKAKNVTVTSQTATTSQASQQSMPTSLTSTRTDSQTKGLQSSLSSQGRQVPVTSQASSATSSRSTDSQSEQVTSLANTATSADVASAKQSATQTYQETGVAQKIVRMDATATSSTDYSKNVSDATGTYTLYKQGTSSSLLAWLGYQLGYTADIKQLDGSYTEPTEASDGVLGVTKHFTIFTFDSLTATNLSGNVRLAVGGNLSLTNSGISDTGEYSTYPEVIVGGDTVQLYNATPAGNVYLNNNTTVWAGAWAGNAGLKLYQLNTSQFFIDAKQYLTSQSNTLSALTQTPGVTVVVPTASNPNLNLNGVKGADEDVFVINSTDIPAVNGAININNVINSAGKTAKVIINVVGDSVSFNNTTISINGNANDADAASNVTWNMPDVVSLITNQAKLSGNLLAPNATFYTNGSMSTDSNIAVKTYGKSELNQFKVQYLDEKGVTIHPEMTSAVLQTAGTTTVRPLNISGYHIDTTKKPTCIDSISGQDTLNNDGTVSVAYSSGFWGSNTINFYYVKNVVPTIAKLTVNYLDDQLKTLRDSQTLTGAINSQYSTSAYEPTIEGYTLDLGSANALTGTLSADQTVNLIYTPNAQSLQVHYVDENGKTLTTPVTLNGQTGSSYDATTDKIKIPGYTFKAVTQGSLTGLFPTDQSNQDITLMYTADSQTVAIEYQDENGQSIAPSVQITGTTGGNYDLTGKQLSIPGYSFTKVTGGTTDDTFINNTPAVIYHYVANQQPLTVEYLDENGQTIATATQQSGLTGTEYAVKVPAIANYTFDSVKSDSQTGTYQAGGQTVKLIYQAIPKSGVTFKFVNAQNGTELQSAQTINGMVGTAYQYTVPQIPGYQLQSTADQEGTYTADGQTVILDYLPDTETGQVNYYLDQTTTSLKPATTLQGANGTSQTVAIPAIIGYQPITTNATMQFSPVTTPVNLYYQPIVAAPIDVIAEYVDGTGKATILSQTTLPTANYGVDYTTSAPTILGYTWNQNKPLNMTGKYLTTPQTVIYQYQKSTAAPVTVNYLDNKTGTMLASTQLTGDFGETVTAQARSFTNYTLVGQSTQTTTKLTDHPQTIEFLYDDATPRTIQVAYVHQVNDEFVALAPETTQTVAYDTDYSVEPKEITGYYLTKDSYSGNLTGSWDDLQAGSDKNQVVFYYNADPESFKINYLDQADNDLFNITPSETISTVNGYYGLYYKVTAPNLAGYTLISPATVNGELLLNPSDITFRYAKDESISIHFVDESGKDLATAQAMTVEYGKEYQTTPVMIAGYRLKIVPSNATGDYQSSMPIVVMYVYTPIVSSSASSQSSVTSTPASAVTSTATSQTSIPSSNASQTTSVATSTTITSESGTPQSIPDSVPSQGTSQSVTSASVQVTNVVTSTATSENSTPASQADSVTSQSTSQPVTSVPSQVPSGVISEQSTPASQLVSVTTSITTSVQSISNSQPSSVTTQTSLTTVASEFSQIVSVATSVESQTPISELTSASQIAVVNSTPAMVAAPLGKVPGKVIISSKTWDPIQLRFKTIGGKVIKVTEVVGYLGNRIDISPLIPIGYHLVNHQRVWLLLNDITPQTVILAENSETFKIVNHKSVIQNWTKPSRFKSVGNVQLAQQPVNPPQPESTRHQSYSLAATSRQSQISSQMVAGTTRRQRANLTKRLPQTSEQRQSWLLVIGIALMSFSWLILGRRKRNIE